MIVWGFLDRLTAECHFLYLNPLFWSPGGSILDTWYTSLVILGSRGTPGRTPWGPDLDFYNFLMDFGVLLGASLEQVL